MYSMLGIYITNYLSLQCFLIIPFEKRERPRYLEDVAVSMYHYNENTREGWSWFWILFGFEFEFVNQSY